MNFHDKITQDIAERGFTTFCSATPEGIFAYTVGLTELGHPEIFISGMLGENCHLAFTDIYKAIKAGHQFKAGEVNTTLAHLPVAFRTLIPEIAVELCEQVMTYYPSRQPTFLQLVLPDREGHLPWQEGYDVEYMRQQRHLWVNLH